MPAEFSLLVARFSQLLSRYHAGTIGTVELAEQLSAERISDTDGGEWTIGASSGAWYRRLPNEAWAQVPPPGSHVRAAVQLVADEISTSPDVVQDPFAKLYPADPERTGSGTDSDGDPDHSPQDIVTEPAFDGLVQLYPAVPDVPVPPSPVPTDGEMDDAFVTDHRGTALLELTTADDAVDPPAVVDDAAELARRWLDG